MSDNPFKPGIKSDLEKGLEFLPDEVADAQLAWRMATLEREKTEAVLYLEFKMGEKKRTADEIKALVRQSSDSYVARLNEAKCESNYTRLNERIMSWKKLASLRTQF